MSEMGALIKKIQIVRNVVIAGALLSASYIGYKAYEKNQTKKDFENTLEFLVLKTNYLIQQDSLDKVHNNQNIFYASQNKLLNENYVAKKDSLMEVYKKNLKK